MAPKPPAPKAEEVDIGSIQVVAQAGSLLVQQVLMDAVRRASGPTFKVAALQSGYTAEFGALNFAEISRLQASALDGHAARVKLLSVVHGRIQEFSCEKLSFGDWMRKTAHGDFDTIMYGLYAATYPGDNEFDVNCRHCGHENKVRTNIGDLARIVGDGVKAEIMHLLDPKTDFKGAIENSLVGKPVHRRLPGTGIVAEIVNPSLQDHLDGVQWFTQAQDRRTGELPPQIAGQDTIRTLMMYVPKLLVPTPGSSQFVEVKGSTQVASLIGRLPQTDGRALVDAVDAEVKRLAVSYQLPAFNCGSCGKRNEDLALDFENLLFFRLRERE
jgi:hypothetical protein